MPEDVTRQFLARLWELQAEAGLSNGQLARLLGCSPSYVSHLRAGRRGRQVGLTLTLAAIRRFPDLGVFLTSELPTGTVELPSVTDREDEH